MKIKIYGSRGSIPVCSKEFQKFGGDTTSILVSTQNRIGIFDAGTGIRQLGKDLLECGDNNCDRIYLAFSHFHWDHIQGFPFFLPAYDKQREIIITMVGKGIINVDVEKVLETLMQQVFFPIPLKEMGAKIRFFNIQKDQYQEQYFSVRSVEHNHPGGALSYRIESENKAIVFSTDVEHYEQIDQRVVELAKDADLLIHDAQFTPEELKYKKGWGHSSYLQAIEVAEKANVKRLILTHHDPDHNDTLLQEIEDECKKRFDKVELAKDRMEIEI